MTNVWLFKGDYIEALSFGVRKKLFKMSLGGRLKRHNVLGFSMPASEVLWAMESKVCHCMGDLCDLIPGSELAVCY